MPHFSRIVLALILILPAIAPSSLAAGDEAEYLRKQERRLEREATNLFKVVLAEFGNAPGRCWFSTDWYSREVPYHLARQYLGRRIRSDVTSPKVGVTTAEILDPAGTHPERFCNTEEFREALQGRMDESLATNSSDSATNSVPQRDFSFPVFDRTFRTAIVLRSSSYYGWFMRDGQLQQSLGLVVDALVYRKANGQWRLVDDERLLSAE